MSTATQVIRNSWCRNPCSSSLQYPACTFPSALFQGQGFSQPPSHVRNCSQAHRKILLTLDSGRILLVISVESGSWSCSYMLS